MVMATTIQVSERLVEKLRRAKEELGVHSYEEVIDRWARQHEVATHPRRGSRPGLRWDPAKDRMKFRSDED
jgi:hypothetical protein